MRKVIFTINDLEWFKRCYNLSDDMLKSLSEERNAFKCMFTLIGEGTTIDRYTLTDGVGNKLNINDLNGFEKGVIINDCYAYFEGRSYSDESARPCGIIDIHETTINE